VEHQFRRSAVIVIGLLRRMELGPRDRNHLLDGRRLLAGACQPIGQRPAQNARPQ
jgi:hypothetical protein